MEFDKQVKDALAQIRSIVGKNVKYKRGTDYVWLNAARGNTFFRFEQEDNIRIQYEEREFLIGVEDIVLGGSEVKPQRGDEIIEEYDNKTYSYTVIQTSASDDVWAYSDSGKTTLRVFAKLKEEANT